MSSYRLIRGISVAAALLAGIAWSGQAAWAQSSDSYKKVQLTSGLRLKFSQTGADGTFQNIGPLTYNFFNLNMLPNGGKGFYEIGFETMPAIVHISEDGLGQKAGSKLEIAKIAAITLFNTKGFQTFTLGTDVPGGQNTGVQLYDWTNPAQPLAGTWTKYTATDPGKSKPFTVGYKDNVNGLFASKQDWAGGAPHARYARLDFSSFSLVDPSSSTYIAMDIMTTTGFTGRIFLIPEVTYLQMLVFLGLGGVGLIRLRRMTTHRTLAT
jgi:hypothetical protein